MAIWSLTYVLSLTSLRCSAAVAMGLYGNEDARKGVREFVKTTKDAASVVVSVRKEVRNTTFSLNAWWI